MSTELTQATTEAASSGGIAALGVNWKIFIAQLVNFMVVLLILWRWVYRPVVKLLDERREKIGASIENAEKIEKDLVTLENRKTEVMREAERQAHGIITEAGRMAEENRTEAAARARAEVEKIVKQGKEQLATDKALMVAEAKNEIADLVVLATSKVLEEKIDATHDRKLVEKVLVKLRG